jgi:hypothetical protein
VFYALLGAFLVRYLRGTDWGQLSTLDFTLLPLLLALPFSLAPRFLQPLAWSILIRSYGESPPPYAQITRVYAISWLGRYIPGKIAWIGAKVFFGRDYGMRPSTLAATSVAEALVQMATALGLSFLLLAISDDVMPLGADVRLLALVALLTMSVVLFPPVFNALAARAYALAGATPDVTGVGRLSVATLLGTGALYVLIHALSGMPIFLVIESFYGALELSRLPVLIAAFLLAGTIGTLAVFAPSGLGVREGILIVLLGFFMPRPVALVAVVVLRLWSIAMDLLYYLMARWLDRLRPMPMAPSPGRGPTPGGV